MTVSASAKRPSHLTYNTSPVVYRILKWIINLLMRIVYRYTVVGQENVPLNGATVIVVNHLHMLDVGAVAPAVPRKIVTLAAGKWRRHLLINAFLRMAGVIYVRRGEIDREALRGCMEVLSKGGALAVAPEGTRSKTRSLQEAKAGVAYFATRTNAAVMPIAITGTEALGAWRQLRRPECRVVIGRPFRLPPAQTKPSSEQLQVYSELIMIRLGMLLPAEYRGVYADRIAAAEAGEDERLAVLQDI